MAIARDTITDYLKRADWKLTREAPQSGRDQNEWWDSPTGERISLPPAQGWTLQDAHRVAGRIAAIDRVPAHQVMGTEPPFDPKSDPVLHYNGRGRAHYAAFRESDDARQARHLTREHSAPPERTRLITGLDTLADAHEWLHDRFDH